MNVLLNFKMQLHDFATKLIYNMIYAVINQILGLQHKRKLNIWFKKTTYFISVCCWLYFCVFSYPKKYQQIIEITAAARFESNQSNYSLQKYTWSTTSGSFRWLCSEQVNSPSREIVIWLIRPPVNQLINSHQLLCRLVIT